MATVVVFNESTGEVTQYLRSANTALYIGRTDVLINPDLTAVTGLALNRWQVSGGVIVATDPPLSVRKAELVAEIKALRSFKFETLTVEHPSLSGNLFGVTLTDQHNWHGLYTARNMASYPIKIRTKNEIAEYSIVDAADVESLFGKVFLTVNTEIALAGAAIQGVMSAGTVAAAEAAANVYLLA